MEPIAGLSPRLNYQRKFAEGKIVNIACGEDPAMFGDEATHVDQDIYCHKNFVQADAHKLPFKDDEFDTAVLGDMLEHVLDPVQVLREAARVAKKIVVTIFEEWRLPGHGQHVDAAIAIKKQEIKDIGFEDGLAYLKSLPTVKDKIVSVKEDDWWLRSSHINQFNDEDIARMAEEADLEVNLLFKHPEGVHEGHTWYNWVLVARKRQH